MIPGRKKRSSGFEIDLKYRPRKRRKTNKQARCGLEPQKKHKNQEASGFFQGNFF